MADHLHRNAHRGVPIGCRSPPKRGPYSTPIHNLPRFSVLERVHVFPLLTSSFMVRTVPASPAAAQSCTTRRARVWILTPLVCGKEALVTAWRRTKGGGWYAHPQGKEPLLYVHDRRQPGSPADGAAAPSLSRPGRRRQPGRGHQPIGIGVVLVDPEPIEAAIGV
jgi:hypothetical protein